MFIRPAVGISIALLFTATAGLVRGEPASNEPASNEPDGRCATLEDFYGDTGTRFRAALGFNTSEPFYTQVNPIGFGVAVDDMVISWKETRLDADTHDCTGSGECATLETANSVSYEGNAVVSLTVTDKTPYDAVNNKNDCNGDGDYLDAADDQDCNDNGNLDVTVKLTSSAEVAGEIAILDQVSPGSPVYKTSFPYSTFYNSPGTIFVQQSGTALPVITARYEDRNDGTGSRCRNALEPSQQGFITATTDVHVTTGRIAIQSYTVNNVSVCSVNTAKQCATNSECAGTCSGLPTKACNTNSDCVGFGTCVGSDGLCNSCSLLPAKPCVSQTQCLTGQGVCTSTANRGDPDGFADTNETINLAVQFGNKSGVDVDDLTATLGTNSPNIECITRSAIIVGALANGALSNTATYLPFQFKVANVNRTSVSQVLEATFTVTVRSNKFDALTRAETISLNLDLTASGSSSTAPFVESFESGFGAFVPDTLDANKRSVVLSDGFRCQYNDPFGPSIQSHGNTDCFLGFAADTTAGVNDWHVHTSSIGPSGGGMGRAFTGKQSLHLGVHADSFSPAQDTTRLKQLDAIKTTNPVALPLPGANPELNFAQQVSLVGSGAGISITYGETADKGVVEVQVATTGVPSGSWIKIYPYVNVYDQQGTDDYSNCMFDPTDDGNDEDSYFDPTDPNRLYGPSSTCFPEFVFVRQGQTDYRKRFDVNDIGGASDGPGLQGCSTPGTCLPANTPSTISNPGTWVRPRFSLVAFAGRTIRIRFLFSSIEVGSTQTMNLFFGRPNIVEDDGWYIDDIHIDQALLNALTLSVDTATITPIPCGACAAVTPALTANPSSLSSPGQIVTLDAKGSTVDRCLNGIVQFQFWADANVNGIVGDAGDALLRDWTDNFSFIDAPQNTTQYGVKARCSADFACDSAGNAIALNVPVTCPTTGTARAAFPQTIRVDKFPTAITWPSAISVDAIRGDLILLRSSLSFTGTVISCLATNSAATTSVADGAADPGVGNAFYYLVRGQTTQFCNEIAPGYTTNSPKEKTGRDTQLIADSVAAACP